MEGRNCFSPDEFPRRAGSSPLSRQLPFKTNFQRMSLLSPSISSPKSPLSLKSKKSYFEDEKEPEMKDPLELVYTISTRRIRKALRSELLHHQEDVEEPFSLRTMDNPPIIADGRRMVIDIPRRTRDIWFYYQHVVELPNGDRFAKRKKRCAKLSAVQYFERNVFGMWKELWIELLDPREFANRSG